MAIQRIRAIVIGCVILASLTPSGRAAEGKVNEGARALLEEVVSAYKGLPAYSDRGEFELDLSINATKKSQKVPIRLTIVRPNMVSFDTGLTRVVSDGKTMSTVVNPLKKYATIPAPATITFDTVFTDGPLGATLFGGPSAPMMMMVMNLLIGPNPAKAVMDLGDSLSLEADRELDGKASRLLKVGSETGPSFLLFVDPSTKLLRAIDLTFDPKALAASFPEGQDVKIERYRWSAGAVSTKAPEAEAFAFKAPEGFTKVDELAKAGGGDEPGEKSKVEGLVGKPAPAFTMTMLDGPGKTKTVSLADLAGKVVMIDFWATWCGPCLAELPEVQKLIESYGKEGKNVVIIALSQDSEPKDPIEVRKLIETTLEKKKLELTASPVGKIALDPSNTVGEAFGVEGYPTVVILDEKGVVRSAHIGYSPEVGKILRGDLDAVLEGKPVPTEKK